MTKEEIQEKYKSLILPESKNPYHFEDHATDVTIEAINPMCGDSYELHLDHDPERINQAHFHGNGCAISKASTSLLMRTIEGEPVDSIIAKCRDFIEAVNQGKVNPGFAEELNLLAELKNFDGRLDCILLSWTSLLKHLEKTK